MKTALDFYARGKQRESNADDYEISSYYIKGRFICPECGEPVYLRPSKYSNFFIHFKKTNETDECERRVDGNVPESVYERIGMPIYLRKKGTSDFSLYMGFKALPGEILILAEKSRSTVNIDGKIKLNINRERFSLERSVMVPLEYIPMSGRKFHLEIYPSNISSILCKYWPDYADGFSVEGALFTVTEQGGRKIRQGDNIATDTEYYWVRRQEQLPYLMYNEGIQMEKVGKIQLLDLQLNVFKGRFRSNIGDFEFRFLANFLRENMKLHLLEKTPEFVPVWPPLIKQEEGYIYPKECNRIYGNVVSGNDNPKTYLYRGIMPVPETLVKNGNIAEFVPNECNVVVNIDRKYVSGGASFIPGIKRIEANSNECSVIQNGHKIEISNMDSKEVFLIQKNGSIEKIKNISWTQFDDLVSGDVIEIVSHRCFVKHIICKFEEEKVTRNINEKEILNIILKYRKASKVQLPYTLRRKLESCRFKNILLKNEINEMKKSNMIAVPLVAILEDYING
ncbi:MAG: hypothetical protein IAC13_04135 [Firmicutes bacterium]|uniref:Uncharacterized protein n=1 Tax=Candidatus Scybalomonas excrementavium TaxID=2840943 RepID=A0A9D9HZD4_9FIRM|nr:hypothetical protein [Candidatus Scybalomonas excrementavium]